MNRPYGSFKSWAQEYITTVPIYWFYILSVTTWPSKHTVYIYIYIYNGCPDGVYSLLGYLKFLKFDISFSRDIWYERIVSDAQYSLIYIDDNRYVI